MKIKKLLIPCVMFGVLFVIRVQAQVQPGDFAEYTDEDGCIVYDFQEVELKIPAHWSGKYDLDFVDGGLDFYHVASREAIQEAGWGDDKGGRLFSLRFSEDTEFEEYLPAYETIGDGEDGTYYLDFPTDVRGYMDDEEIGGEWLDMAGDLDWITYHAVMKDFAANVTGSVSCGDYILPDSDQRYLEKGELVHMNVRQMQMAINEIYARHGRRFRTPEIRDYFVSKLWYDGTIAPQEFDEAVFNSYENENIALIKECMVNPPLGIMPVEYGVTAELEAVNG